MPTMIRSRSPQSRMRPAAAAVEAALVLPILLLFLVAAIDLGRLGRVADSVSNAARNGAQFGCANTGAAADTAAIRAAAVTEMANLPNVTSTNPTVTATSVTCSGTNFIQVTVTYDMTGVFLFNLFPATNITRTVQMPMMPQ